MPRATRYQAEGAALGTRPGSAESPHGGNPGRDFNAGFVPSFQYAVALAQTHNDWRYLELGPSVSLDDCVSGHVIKRLYMPGHSPAVGVSRSRIHQAHWIAIRPTGGFLPRQRGGLVESSTWTGA